MSTIRKNVGLDLKVYFDVFHTTRTLTEMVPQLTLKNPSADFLPLNIKFIGADTDGEYAVAQIDGSLLSINGTYAIYAEVIGGSKSEDLLTVSESGPFDNLILSPFSTQGLITWKASINYPEGGDTIPIDTSWSGTPEDGHVPSSKLTKQTTDTNATAISSLSATVSALDTKVDNIDTDLTDKADKTYVDTQLASKADTTYVDTQLATKQDTIVAGDNITIAADGKTISADSSVFVAEQNVTSASELLSAIGDGKVVMLGGRACGVQGDPFSDSAIVSVLGTYSTMEGFNGTLEAYQVSGTTWYSLVSPIHFDNIASKTALTSVETKIGSKADVTLTLVDTDGVEHTLTCLGTLS